MERSSTSPIGASARVVQHRGFREELPDDEREFGIGVEVRGLTPFRSVAVDDRVIPIGTHIYVPDLDGVVMPGVPPWGGFVHDGCLVADDRGSAIGDQHLDFFVAAKVFYISSLDARVLRRGSGQGLCWRHQMPVNSQQVPIDPGSISATRRG